MSDCDPRPVSSVELCLYGELWRSYTIIDHLLAECQRLREGRDQNERIMERMVEPCEN